MAIRSSEHVTKLLQYFMGRIYPFNEIFLVAHNPKAEHLNINKLLEESSSCATRHHMATVGDGGAGAPLVGAAIYLYLLTLDYDHQSSRSLEETRLDSTLLNPFYDDDDNTAQAAAPEALGMVVGVRCWESV